MPNSFKARASSHALALASTLITGVIALSFTSTGAQAQANPDAGEGSYYFFGDSATGQGNWSAIVGERGEDHAPYSSNNGFQRESNGLIWAEMLGRDVDIVLDPDADSPNVNFAISGAHMTRGGDLTEFGVETGVVTQTELFSAIVDNGGLSVGRDDVAFMLAGGNDFLDGFDDGLTVEAITADFASAAALNVRTLADAGVKTIILSEMQPIQYAPEFADDAELQATLAGVVDQANAAMLAAVGAEGLPADVNIVTMKYVSMVDYITSNGPELGFANVTGSCIDQETDELCSPDRDGQNQYLFFDDLHFTERAQRIEAQWWLATLAGANGSASRQAARMPRVVYEQLEAHRHFVRPGAHTDDERRFSAWAAPVRTTLELKSAGPNPHTDFKTEGVVMGLEARPYTPVIIGGALSLNDTDAVFRDGGRYKLEGGEFSVYGALEHDVFGRLSATFTRGWHEIDEVNRVTGVDLLSASGFTDSRYWDVELAARSVDEIGPFEIGHGVSVATGRIKVDGFDERGAQGLALRFDEQSFTYRLVSVDAIVRGPELKLARSVDLRPFVDGAYTYQFGDDDYRLRSQLIDNTARAVTVLSNAPTEHRFDAGVGAELTFGDRWSLSGRYARQWADDIEDAEEASLTLRASF